MCWVIDNRMPADFFFRFKSEGGWLWVGSAEDRGLSQPSWVCCPWLVAFHPSAWPLGLQVAATLPDRRRVGKGFQLLSASMRKVSAFPGTSHHPRLTPAWGSPVQHRVTGSLVQRRLGKAESHSVRERVWDEGGGERSLHAGPQSVNRAGSLGPWSQAVSAPKGRVDLL